MPKYILVMLAVMVTISTPAQSEGLFDGLVNRKKAAFQECTESFEKGERREVINAASMPVGAIGSTYIPRDKGAWMITCMDSRGYSLAFDSLLKLNSSELAGMPREKINSIRKEDANRAAINIDGWK